MIRLTRDAIEQQVKLLHYNTFNLNLDPDTVMIISFYYSTK